MKSAPALLCLTLLFPLAATATHLCNEKATPDSGKVKIELDATGKANPDRCEVYSGTVVKWHGPKAFTALFTTNSPEQGGNKEFKSHHVFLDHEQAGFTAKDVKQQETDEYNVTVDKAKADPVIIIDPK